MENTLCTECEFAIVITTSTTQVTDRRTLISRKSGKHRGSKVLLSGTLAIRTLIGLIDWLAVVLLGVLRLDIQYFWCHTRSPFSLSIHVEQFGETCWDEWCSPTAPFKGPTLCDHKARYTRRRRRRVLDSEAHGSECGMDI